MKTTAPYLRPRKDGIWEIVSKDPKTGSTRRESTKTREKFEAEKALAAFAAKKAADASPTDPTAPRLRKRTDGYWETVWKDEGKTRRHAHGTKEQPAASAAHRAFTNSLMKPEIPVRPTVAWIVDRYYDYICREKKESTSGPMAANVAPLKDRLGDLFWDDIVQDVVDEYIHWRMEKPRWKSHQDFEGQYGSTSRNTACKDLRVLRAALKRARKNRYIAYPPDFAIEEGEPSRDTKVWLTMEEMQRMIAVCAPTPIYVNGKEIDRVRDRSHIEGFLRIALATGARKEAILSLTWDQVYIPDPQGQIRERTPSVSLLRKDGMPIKANRSFEVTYAKPFLDVDNGTHIEGAYIDFGERVGNKRRPAIPIGNNWPLLNYLLFLADRDQPYVISYNGKPVKSLKRGLADVAKEAGVTKPVTHHTMKRTAITTLVRAGVELEVIAEMVNTTVAVLKEHYNMHRPEIAEALGSAVTIH